MSVPRILYNNLLKAPGVVVTVSSALDTLPATNILDQSPSLPWRTKIGWTVGIQNNKIKFNRSGAHTATVASGYYATAAAVCTAVVAAMEIADSAPAWACTYSGTTHKFTINTAADAFELDVSSTANFLADMGFVASTTGSLTYTAESEAYQGRHWISIDLGTTREFDTAIILASGIPVGGWNSVYVQASASILSDGLDEVQSVSEYMGQASGEYLSFRFPAVQSYQFLRFVISGIAVADGYTEIPVVFVGTGMLTNGVFEAEIDAVEELSEISYAAGGAHHVLDRATRNAPELGFQIIGATQLATWKAFRAAVKIGVCFFFQLDDEDEESYLYVFLTEPMKFDFEDLSTIGKVFTTTLALKEALG